MNACCKSSLVHYPVRMNVLIHAHARHEFPFRRRQDIAIAQCVNPLEPGANSMEVCRSQMGNHFNIVDNRKPVSHGNYCLQFRKSAQFYGCHTSPDVRVTVNIWRREEIDRTFPAAELIIHLKYWPRRYDERMAPLKFFPASTKTRLIRFEFRHAMTLST